MIPPSSSQTDRLNAALADRYRIERHLGEGGMATVYLAQDLKHDRQVAVKVLKPELAAVLGAERFVQEIKTTASLQHPHILPLFDSGTADGFLFYVMPYIKGETLRDRLNRETQLGVDDAVRIARDVADALDYAHRNGVIHRDIKPENILLHDGRPMVVDFGIALAVSAAAGGRMTETGLSLGTPHYMSPEQATAEKDITARSDIYSIGSVLYEMLTGNPPHTGASAQQIIMKIITEPAAPVTTLRKSVPPNVAAAVARSLEKLPADRFESARAFAEALGNPAYAYTPAHAHAHAHATVTGATVPRTSSRHRLVRDAGFALVGAALVGAAVFARRADAPAVLVPARFRIDLPDSVTLSTESAGNIALSRDGTLLAAICDKDGVHFVCVRHMDDPTAQVVRGTDGASYPSFSPRGDWLLFSAGGMLKKVPVAGGNAETLGEARNIAGLTSESSWGENGIILYSNKRDLLLVSADMVNRRVLAKYDTSRSVVSQPEMLPDGRYALVALRLPHSVRDSTHLGVISLKDGAVSDLGITGMSPHYAAGQIVFARADGLLATAPFSLARRVVTGAIASLGLHVWQYGLASSAFAVSRNGSMAFVPDESTNIELMYVVDRDGKERVLKSSKLGFKEPRLSPDGRHVAVRIGLGPTDGGLWIHDIAAGSDTRLTADSESIRGEWSHDGTHVVYVDHANADTVDVVTRPWDGSGAPRILARGSRTQFFELAIGPANGFSAIRRGGSQASDIVLAPTDSLNAARLFIRGTPSVVSPRVSSTGRWLAYTSNETGRNEVYVRQIPGPGPVVQVSVDGGTEPMWSADESTLFYRGPRRLMQATIVERPALAATHRDSLFVDSYRRYFQHAAYDVFPNGREFLMTRGPVASRSELYVIVNWTQLIGTQRDHDTGH